MPNVCLNQNVLEPIEKDENSLHNGYAEAASDFEAAE